MFQLVEFAQREAAVAVGVQVAEHPHHFLGARRRKVSCRCETKHDRQSKNHTHFLRFKKNESGIAKFSSQPRSNRAGHNGASIQWKGSGAFEHLKKNKTKKWRPSRNRYDRRQHGQVRPLDPPHYWNFKAVCLVAVFSGETTFT